MIAYPSLLIAFTVIIGLLCATPCYSVENAEISSKKLISKEQLLARGQVSHDHFVLNSVPKSGTHYIMKCLYYMINKPVDAGYDYFQDKPSISFLQQYLVFLENLKGENFIHKMHIPYFPEVENVLLQAQCKWIFCLRDPRDALVSLAFQNEKFKGNTRDFIWVNADVYDELSFDDKIAALMTGSCCKNYLHMFRQIIKWKNSPHGLMIKFEDLIGPKGGGTKQKQLDAIRQMVAYLNINLSEDEVEAVAEHSFIEYPSQTADGNVYKRSQIGSWKNFLNESNKKLFKQLFNAELIEAGYEQDENWD